MEALKTAQWETNSIVAERSVLEVLTRNIRPAVDRKYNFGYEILAHLGTIKRGIGLFDVVHVE